MFTKAQGDRLRRIRAIEKLIENFRAGSAQQLISLFAQEVSWEIPTISQSGSGKPPLYQSLSSFFQNVQQVHVTIARRHIADESVVLEGFLTWHPTFTRSPFFRNIRFCAIFRFNLAIEIVSLIAFTLPIDQIEASSTEFVPLHPETSLK